MPRGYAWLKRFKFDSSGSAIEWQFVRSTGSKDNNFFNMLNKEKYNTYFIILLKLVLNFKLLFFKKLTYIFISMHTFYNHQINIKFY